MPQTKHAVVFFGLAVLVSVGTPLLGSFFHAPLNDMSASVQTALNPEALAPVTMIVDSENAEGREVARENILAELVKVDDSENAAETTFPASEVDAVPAAEEVLDIEESVVSKIDTTPRVVSSPEKGALFACESSLANPMQSPTFIKNGITTSVVEGARVISPGLDIGVPQDASTTIVARPILQVPQRPQSLGSPRCVAQGPVGVTQAGMLIESGEAYSSFPSRNTEGVFGYARDGFGIFGAKENGVNVQTEDLDECHGHTHQIYWDEQLVTMYHYHVTDEFPYTVGCFRAQPEIVTP